MIASRVTGYPFGLRSPYAAGQTGVKGNHIQKGFGFQNSAQDSLTISPQGKAASAIEQLLKQKEAIKERKNEFMNTALEEGRTMDSMRPQLEIYEEQIQAIDDQIDQITAQQTQETMQKTQTEEKPENKQPKTEEELQQEKLNTMMTLSTSIENVKTVDRVRTQTQGESAVLKSEIELDKQNANGLEGAQKMIEKKEEQLDELEDKAQSLTAQVGQELSNVTEEVQEAAKTQTDDTVQTGEKEEDKKQELCAGVS